MEEHVHVPADSYDLLRQENGPGDRGRRVLVSGPERAFVGLVPEPLAGLLEGGHLSTVNITSTAAEDIRGLLRLRFGGIPPAEPPPPIPGEPDR